MNLMGPGALQQRGQTVSNHHRSRRRALPVGSFRSAHGTPAWPVSRSLTVHAVFRSEAGPHTLLEPAAEAVAAQDGGEPGGLAAARAVRRIEREIRRLAPATFDGACVQIADLVTGLPPAERRRTVAEIPRWILARLAADGRCVHLCARLAFRLYHELAEPAARERGRPFAHALRDACRAALDAPLASVEPDPHPCADAGPSHSAQRPSSWTVKFIGELCRLEIIPRELLEICFDRFFSAPQHRQESVAQESVEDACLLLVVVGQGLERTLGKKRAMEFLERLQRWLEDPKLSSRSRFIILDALEISSRGWKTSTLGGGGKWAKESELLPPPQQQQQQQQQRLERACSIAKISEIRDTVEQERRKREMRWSNLTGLCKPLVDRYLSINHHSTRMVSKADPSTKLVVLSDFEID